MTNQVKDSYNKYELFPKISYNCISYLLENDETIWKLLKYSEANAWQKSNLTKAEKSALIYSGQLNETDFRVFMDASQDIAWTKECAILRISVFEIIPTTHVYGNISVGMEAYAHHKINHMSNYQTRVDTIIQRLIETFNGAEIGGLGRLYFDASEYSRSKAITIGQIPWKGKVLIMSNWII